MSNLPAPEMPEYKGAPLSPDRGPGLGCFWIQVVALVVFMILAPLSAVLNWGPTIATLLLIGVVVLLLLVGQTSIFLLRLVLKLPHRLALTRERLATTRTAAWENRADASACNVLFDSTGA